MPAGRDMGRGARKMSAAPKRKRAVKVAPPRPEITTDRTARKVKTARGPQGLPTQARSTQRPAPKKTASKKTARKRAPSVFDDPLLEGGALHRQRREERDKVREAETKAVREGRIGPRVRTKRHPTLDDYTPAQRAVILRDTPKADLDDRRLADRETRRQLNKSAGAAQTSVRRGDTSARRLLDRLTTTEADRRERAEETARRAEEQTRRELDRQMHAELTRPRSDLRSFGTDVDITTGKRPENKSAKQIRRAQTRAVDTIVRKAAATGADPKAVEKGVTKAISKQQSPALKILEETQRPIRAVSGAVEAVAKGKSVPKAVARGLVKNKGPGFQKVLKDAGAPKAVAAIGGFALDVAGDPTTYITFGTASVGRKVAVDAAERAAKKAARKGLDRAAQERLARAAYRRELKKQGVKAPRVSENITAKARPEPKGRRAVKRQARDLAEKVDRDTPVVGGERGVVARFAGQEIPGVRRATGKAHKLKRQRVGDIDEQVIPGLDVHGAVRQVRPQVRPKGVGREEYDLVRAELRGGRHQRAQASAEAERTARTLERSLRADPARYERVIDLVESGKATRGLSKAQVGDYRARVKTGDVKGADDAVADAVIAKRLRDANKGRGRTLRRAGVDLGDVERGNKKAQARAGTKAVERVQAQVGEARAAVARAQEKEDVVLRARKRGVIPTRPQPTPALRAAEAEVRAAERAVARLSARKRAGRRVDADGVRSARQRVRDARSQLSTVRASTPTLTPGQADKLIFARAEKTIAARKAQAAREAASPAGTHAARQAAEREAKRSSGNARGYIPHVPEPQPRPGLSRASRRKQRQGFQESRTDPRPISVQNATRDDKLSTDLPALIGQSGVSAGKATEAARATQALRRVGEPLTKGRKVFDDEIVLHLKGNSFVQADPKTVERIREHGMTRVTKKGDLKPSTPKKGREAGGRFVVVKRELHDEIVRRQKTSDPDATFMPTRKAIGAWKKVIYYNPAFQGRNAIGDTLLAYGEVSPGKLAKETATAGRTLRAVSTRERAQGRVINPKASVKQGRAQKVPGVRRADPGQTKVKVGGENMTLDRFIDELFEDGIIRANRAFEFEDMLNTARAGGQVTTGKARNKASQVGVSPRRWLENREDAMRIAVYKSLRDKGLTREQASNRTADVLIDYGELSQLEKGLRGGLMPFYTFSARQLPEQSKRLFTRPGKIASLEKSRQNLMQATGGDQENLSEWEQRNVPFVMGLRGPDNRVIMFSPPQTLLNEAPNPFEIHKFGSALASVLSFGGVGDNRKLIEQGDEWMKFAVQQLGPWKLGIELLSGSSSFFRAPIEPEYAPLRPAPAWAKHLPQDTLRAAGYTENYVDKRTGKRVPAWRGNASYIQQQVMPGLPGAITKLATPGQDTSKQTTLEKVIGLSGAQSRRSVTLENAMGRMFNEREKLMRQRGALSQQMKGKGPHPRDVVKAREFINERIGLLEKEIGVISRELGYAVPYFENRTGGKKRARKKGALSGGGVGSGALSGKGALGG